MWGNPNQARFHTFYHPQARHLGRPVANLRIAVAFSVDLGAPRFSPIQSPVNAPNSCFANAF